MNQGKRTWGIVIVAATLFLFILPALFMTFVAGISGPPDKTIFEKIIRKFFLFLPLFFLSGGIGILLMKGWARTLTLGLSATLVSFLAYGFAKGLYAGTIDGQGIFLSGVFLFLC